MAVVRFTWPSHGLFPKTSVYCIRDSGLALWSISPVFLAVFGSDTQRTSPNCVFPKIMSYVGGQDYDSSLQEIFRSVEAIAQNDPELSRATVSPDANSSSVCPWTVTECFLCYCHGSRRRSCHDVVWAHVGTAMCHNIDSARKKIHTSVHSHLNCKSGHCRL